MRRILLVLAALAAAVTAPTAAQANLGDTSRFSVSFQVSPYPCTGGCGQGACGSFRMVTFGPDFDSCNGFSGISTPLCGTGSGIVALYPDSDDPGYVRVPVEMQVAWVGAHAMVQAMVLGQPFVGTGAVLTTPSPLLAVGSLVDACDGFGPPITANISVTGVITGSL
jgi:hypothetical protein